MGVANLDVESGEPLLGIEDRLLKRFATQVIAHLIRLEGRGTDEIAEPIGAWDRGGRHSCLQTVLNATSCSERRKAHRMKSSGEGLLGPLRLDLRSRLRYNSLPRNSVMAA